MCAREDIGAQQLAAGLGMPPGVQEQMLRDVSRVTFGVEEEEEASQQRLREPRGDEVRVMESIDRDESIGRSSTAAI